MISIVPALQRYLQSESILSAVASGGHWMPWAFPVLKLPEISLGISW